MIKMVRFMLALAGFFLIALATNSWLNTNDPAGGFFGNPYGRSPGWGSIIVEGCQKLGKRYHCTGTYHSHCCDISLKNATVAVAKYYPSDSTIEPVHNDSGVQESTGQSIAMSTPSLYNRWMHKYEWHMELTLGISLLFFSIFFPNFIHSRHERRN